MKIITYNIWNDKRGWPDRLEQICEEIKNQNADIVCLQEVPNENICKTIVKKCGYEFYCFGQFDTCEIAILSKLQFITKRSYSEALIINVMQNDYNIEIINVHLPYDSILKSEKQIIALVNENKNTKADYSILCGDFNTDEQSSIHNFLLGKQSLYNSEVSPYWNDLAMVHENLTGIKPIATLDLSTNPRWKRYGYKESAGIRMDWMMMRETYPKPEPKFNDFGLFGTNISIATGYCASDHYGVFAVLDFENTMSTI